MHKKGALMYGINVEVEKMFSENGEEAGQLGSELLASVMQQDNAKSLRKTRQIVLVVKVLKKISLRRNSTRLISM